MKINSILKNELMKPVFFIIILFFIGSLFLLWKRYHLEKCDMFTIGKFSHIHSQYRQGQDACFDYFIEKKRYSTCLSIKNEDRVSEKLIYIRYSCDNPALSEGVWDKKVDSLYLKNIPPDGWDKLPE